MTDLPTLIARIEAATGPDRALDAEIAAMMKACPPNAPGWVKNWSGLWAAAPKINYGAVGVWGIDDTLKTWWNALKFTKSLDDAMTLVPDGSFWNILTSDANLSRYDAVVVASRLDQHFEFTRAATPALAVVAAVLKARLP